MAERLLQGDCLNLLPTLEAGSVDMILTDPPYGTTACKWDSVIPLEPMWEQVKRIIKSTGAIVMTASQPFTTTLISSNMKMFKYCWIWEKERPSNFFQAKFTPLNNTEDVCVFSIGGCNNGSKNPIAYNPQGLREIDVIRGNSNTGGMVGKAHKTPMANGKKYRATAEGYPFKRIKFCNDKGAKHPTQKPIKLMEYLIKTYTNEGDTVLDFAMGSGTTGVACKNLNRDFIGMELDPGYFEVARERIGAV